MNVVITGASQGIGYETVKLFLKEGHKVFSIARTFKKLEKLSNYGNNYPLKCDLTKENELKNSLKFISNKINHIDVLINNAGYLINKPFEHTTKTDFNKTISVNLQSPFFLSQKLLPLLIKSKSPQILNIGSMGGYQSSSKFPGISIYSTAKGALAILTECLAEELKPLNIKVNCLALGAVQTEMLSKVFPNYKSSIKPYQMAEFIYNFTQVDSKFINGKIIPVTLNTP